MLLSRVSPGCCWNDCLSPSGSHGSLRPTTINPSVAVLPWCSKRAQNISLNTQLCPRFFSFHFKFTKAWIQLLTLFDSKAKGLNFCLFVLQVFLESGSESFNSIFLYFFFLSRVIEDDLPIIHFNFLTSVHFSLLNLVSFCDHRAYLLLSLPPGSGNTLSLSFTLKITKWKSTLPGQLNPFWWCHQ